MSGNIAVDIGDTVEVPGGMLGVVRFLGTVNGKAGTFAGVELTREFASRGKNDGDVDGIRYFNTNVPGSGIFLPAHRAVKQDAPAPVANPSTPSNYANMDLAHRNAGIPGAASPPTPSMAKLSRSVGPGARPNFSQSVGPGASPTMKSKPRTSLARPASPVRKQPPPMPTSAAGSRTSTGVMGAPRPTRLSGAGPPTATTPGRFGSPTPRAAAASRSPSRSSSRLQDYTTIDDLDNTPVAIGSRMSNGLGSTMRPRTTRAESTGQSNDEVQRLTKRLEERDRQLKDQASSLAEMENSLAELQTMMAKSSGGVDGLRSPGADGAEEFDAAQLRALLREKNDRISMLTTEFDSHRADFRSTIDTLEMASTETERVYEKRVEELLQEINATRLENDELRGRTQDVDAVAKQLRQLEDLVQELEEGLEDARRGEAEARGEVEFLRGEVERGRSELRREREKAAAALKGAGAAVADRGLASPGTPNSANNSQALEQREDEIRGLKAIIHSLSAGPDVSSPVAERSSARANANQDELKQLREQMEKLQRDKSELQGLVDRKNFREEELERELVRVRETATSSTAPGRRTLPLARDSVISDNRQSVKTVVTADNGRPSSLSAKPSDPTASTSPFGHRRQPTAVLAATEESLPSSSVTSESLWCEICETAGHDVLTCTNIGGPGLDAHHSKAEDPGDSTQQTSFFLEAANDSAPGSANGDTFLETPQTRPFQSQQRQRTSKDDGVEVFKKPSNEHISAPAPLTLHKDVNSNANSGSNNNGNANGNSKGNGNAFGTAMRRASSREEPSLPPATSLPALPKPPDGDGPVAGKSSGVIDMARWCAMCERDGHESVDCPFEEDY